MMFFRLLPTALLVLTARSVSAACGTFVVAQNGDTCATLASLAGITVTQFVRSNPNVTGCDKLTTGENYCVDPNAAPTRATSAAATAPTGSGGLVVTTDGHCGDGFTCAGSEFGDCCSEHGWCGASTEHCGPKCQKPFGICAGSSDTSVATSPTSPTGGAGSTTRVTVTITQTISRISTTTAPGGGPGGATTRTVTLPGTTVTSGSTRTITVTLPTTVTSNLTVTRTATQTAPVTSVRTVPTTLTVPTTVYNNQPGATITVISRTTATVVSTSISLSVWEVTLYDTRTETTTETETVPVTHNVFRTITETTTVTRTAAGAPTTVYRTERETITPAPRTSTVTRTEYQVLETYITSYRTVQVVNTVTVQVAIPTTVTRTVREGGNQVTVTRWQTVTMFQTVPIVQIGGGGDRTVTVIKTITAPGNYIGGGTVTVTRTTCDSWLIGGLLGRR